MRFADYGKRVVFAAFDGGEITTDAGVLLLRERARRIHLFERMAACFTDRRDPVRAVHTLPALLAQRVAGIALGYEDINDHDALRHDPACKLLAGGGGKPAPANGKAAAGACRQVHAEPRRARLGHRRAPIPSDLPQSQETLQPVRHPVSRRPPYAACTPHPRYRRHRRGDPRMPGERLLPRLLPTPLLPAALCLLRPPSPARPTPTRQHRRRQGRPQPDPAHRPDDPRTMAQRRHSAARRQWFRAREPDALVRGKCRGLRLRPGAQRGSAQESPPYPRQGRHGHGRNRPAGPRLRRFPPHDQIQNLGPPPARPWTMRSAVRFWKRSRSRARRTAGSR